MTEPKDRVWKLRCNNEKCKNFFDYFGRLRSKSGIACTHCGKISQYGVADFMRHNSVE
jgi:hypothetical protein